MSDRELATVAELEAGLRQLHAMEMETRLTLERVEALVTAAIRVLHRAELVHEQVVLAEADARRGEIARSHDDARVRLGPAGNKHAVDVPPIDCASLLHLCQARCCRFTVPLDFQDLDDGLRWEYARPYELKRRIGDGYCVYSTESLGCDVYAKRPSICRSYDCRTDPRVWEDFAAKKPAPWQADVGVPELIQIRLPSPQRR